eukprot:TRINITY_DN468_c0_g1_i3.p1 TRINITY_DN468_c0_g1~~TRINITY_DN468_c0_g1_i3.p1  ORF type:complete len:1404 (+),score=349.38 TRINITY_DN468_c0_g1_i3:453-4214(+)
MIHELDLDVIMLQETFLSKADDAHFEGYTVYRRDRAEPKTKKGRLRRGGVATLVKKNLTSEQTYTTDQKSFTERTDVTIYLDKEKKITFVNVYLPPGTATDKFKPESLPVGDNHVIAGDFNSHAKLWARRDNEDILGKKLQTWMLKNDMLPMNDPKTPTLHTTRGTLTTPDIVMAGSKHDRSTWCTLDTIGSDHLPMYFEVRAEAVRSVRVKKKSWVWRKADMAGFTAHVEEGAGRLTGVLDVTKASDMFVKLVLGAAEKFIPRKGERKGRPWWTDEIDAQVKRRNTLKKAVMESEKPPTKAQLVKLADEQVKTQKLIDSSKLASWDEEMQRLSKQPSKTDAYRLIKKIDGRGDKQGVSAIRVGDKFHVTDAQKANALTEAFAQKCTPTIVEDSLKEIERLRSDVKATPPQRQKIQLSEVEDAVSALRRGKSPGPDGVCAEMLQNLGPRAMDALLHIYNLSWRDGYVPADWKRTHVKPLLKKHKDPTLADSYRPISLTSLLAKAMERIVKKRMEHLQLTCEVDAPSPRQSGFRTGRSTEENILYAVDRMRVVKSLKRTGGILFLDLKGAFDTVWHAMLSEVLRVRGYPADYVAWIDGFLSNRSIAADVEGTLGNKRRLEGGVPQGTVLAPFLFSEYVDTLARKLDEHNLDHCIYADDIAIFIDEKNDFMAHMKLQEAITVVERWCRRYAMELSRDKTEYLSVGSDAAGIDVRYGNGDKLRQVKEARYLGVQLDADITMDAHVETVIHKMCMRMRVMRKLAGTTWGMRRDTLRTLYLTYVLPVARYALGALGPLLSEEHVKRIAGKHAEAARLVTGLARKTSARVVLAEAGLQMFEDILTADSLMLYEASRRKEDTVGYFVAAKGGTSEDSWRGKMMKAAKAWGMPDADMTPVGPCSDNKTMRVPPWESVQVDIRPTLKKNVRRTDPDEVRLAAALETLKEMPDADYEVYTDGSAPDNENGGAGVYARCGSRWVKGHRSAGIVCTSFKAEMVALGVGLQWVLSDVQKRGAGTGLNMYTDSQSVLKWLQRGPGAAQYREELLLWNLIRVLCKKGLRLTLQYVPAHCGLDGNEKADKLATEASTHYTTAGTHIKTIDFKTLKPRIKRLIYNKRRRLWLEDHAKDEPYKDLTGGRFHSLKTLPTRKAEVHVMRLRARQSPLLRGYLSGKADAVVECDFCTDKQTLEHILLDCPMTARVRADKLGSYTLKELMTTEVARTHSYLDEMGYFEVAPGADDSEDSNASRDDAMTPTPTPTQ